MYIVHGISSDNRYIREEIPADQAVNASDAREQVRRKHPTAQGLSCRPLDNAVQVHATLSNVLENGLMTRKAWPTR